MKICFFILWFLHINGFLRIPFGPTFKISDREIRKRISINLPKKEADIVKNINGFYGLIGPDVDMKTVSNIYDLFTGDGLIQGIFFDDGEVTFVRHFIRTNKIVYEEENGRIPNNVFIKLAFGLLNKLSILPNALGLANTAILNINKKNYALYERDVPYEIDINFINKTINTINKVSLNKIPHFSAHSKYNNGVIETIDYDVLSKTVSHFVLAPNFDIIKKHSIQLSNLPIIHDFLSTNTTIILFDSPITFTVKKFNSPMPIMLDKSKDTIIHAFDKTTGILDKYYINESMYVFHYANYKENDTHIDIYAPMYDALDFSDLDIAGKYRLISINKIEKKVTVIKNPELENLNIDFPISYGNRTLFRTLENKINNGFVICENLNIIKHLIFEDKFICGEPAVQNISGVFYLFTYAFDIHNNSNSVLMIINLDNYEKIEIPLHENISLGFHSTFIKNAS
jgi:carotenoid cleavage dioxygenase-like enzyme